MQDKLVSHRNDATLDHGKLGCDTIRNNLSQGGFTENHQFPGLTSELVKAFAAEATVTKQLNKVGILGIDAGEKDPGLSCEFALLETSKNGKELQFGIVATGLFDPVEPALAKGIHQALLDSQ
jgi:hypothetical protein